MSARTIANLRGASRGRLGESACTDQYLLRAFSSETTPISPVFGPGLRFQGMCGDDRTAGVEDGTVFDEFDEQQGLQTQRNDHQLVADGTTLLGLQADSVGHDAGRSRGPSGRGEVMQAILEATFLTSEPRQRYNSHSLECSSSSANTWRIGELAVRAFRTMKALRNDAVSDDQGSCRREQTVSKCGKLNCNCDHLGGCNPNQAVGPSGRQSSVDLQVAERMAPWITTMALTSDAPGKGRIASCNLLDATQCAPSNHLGG